ncbi:hypothetical protein DNTS_024404 [Danionella cerebrum]|uniref:Uncharacterized protein n=1 Tax=Danionella cerebrum TaxID=2873325 RepID=A0A553RKH4_9TELE|nr:hypothetical protein DNTS_024404 [Danionella translucida]
MVDGTADDSCLLLRWLFLPLFVSALNPVFPQALVPARSIHFTFELCSEEDGDYQNKSELDAAQGNNEALSTLSDTCVRVDCGVRVIGPAVNDGSRRLSCTSQGLSPPHNGIMLHQLIINDQSSCSMMQMEVEVADEKRLCTRSKVPLEPAIQELFRKCPLRALAHSQAGTAVFEVDDLPLNLSSEYGTHFVLPCVTPWCKPVSKKLDLECHWDTDLHETLMGLP